MSYFTIIEIVGSVLYLFQKIFLSFGNRLGWLLGFLGAISFTIVTLHKESFAYAVLEVTSGVVFIFGLFVWKRNKKVEKQVTFLMSSIVLIGVFVTSYFNLGSPNWILENIMVLLFSFGAVLLVLKNKIGWVLYILGHLVLIFYAQVLGTYYILGLQVVSLPFAFIGYKNFKLVSTQSND